jgi:hypothetical protein
MFKGQRIFAVWEVDDQGSKLGQYPIFSLGPKKSIALGNHLEEFKSFIEECKKDQDKEEIDLRN